MDEVRFVAPVEGNYQIEIYGFTKAEYQLQVEVADTGATAAQTSNHTSADKPEHSRPLVPVNSEPGDKVAIDTLAPTQPETEIFIPLITR